jgi:hypothetical protein
MTLLLLLLSPPFSLHLSPSLLPFVSQIQFVILYSMSEERRSP